MKYLKYIILGVVLWQLFVLILKENKVKKVLSKWDTSDSIKVLINEMISINKQLIETMKQADIQDKIKRLDNYIAQNERLLEDKLTLLKEYAVESSDSQTISKMVDNILGLLK